MDALRELCNTDDFVALVLLAVLANIVGQRMAGENATACRLSWRYAGGAFLSMAAGCAASPAGSDATSDPA